MSVTVMRDITRAVKPPRAAFLDFPPGHTTGRPFDPAQQTAIIRATLTGLETINESGRIEDLPFSWPDGEDWKRTPLPDRAARHESPQYQSDADRLAALDHTEHACPVCVGG